MNLGTIGSLMQGNDLSFFDITKFRLYERLLVSKLETPLPNLFETNYNLLDMGQLIQVWQAFLSFWLEAQFFFLSSKPFLCVKRCVAQENNTRHRK